jgi:hypothetical protein
MELGPFLDNFSTEIYPGINSDFTEPGKSKRCYMETNTKSRRRPIYPSFAIFVVSVYI